MADVSVRFQVAGDAEIVLNLATPQAVRLVEAIMRKVAEAMGVPERPAVGAMWPDVPSAQAPFAPDRR
ncbi:MULTISPECIES: hypothetical protein [unclassified Frankia]